MRTRRPAPAGPAPAGTPGTTDTSTSLDSSATPDSPGREARRPTDEQARFSRLPFGAWTPRRAALAAVLILIVINLAVASMLGGSVAAIVMPLFGVEPDTKLFGAANGLIEKSTMLAVGVLCLAFLARPRIASHFGLTGRPIGGWLRVVAAGVLGAVAINLALAVYEASVGKQGATVGVQLREMGLGTGAAADLCLIAAIVIVAPVAEEYLFRALLHKGARDGLARWMPRTLAIGVAAAISSVVFVQIHLDPAQVGYWPIYLVFGLACALAYEFTGSLAAPILVHVLNNGWAFWRGASSTDAAFSSPWLYVVLVLAPVAAVTLSVGMGRLLGDRSAAGAPSTR